MIDRGSLLNFHFKNYFFIFSFAWGIGPSLVSGQIITTVAGNGIPGFSGDGGPALSAMAYDIHSVATDYAGNLYIDDSANERIRRVDAATQIITTVAGNGISGFSGDGGLATLAQFKNINGIAMNTQGDLFIADSGNSRIRKVDKTTGIVTTIAGNGIASFTGDGGPAVSASLRSPCGIFVDALGNIYIADTYNCRIRRVDGTTGIMTTVAGNGTCGYSGDGGLAAAGELYFPFGVAADAGQNIFIADTYNNLIRRVDAVSGIITSAAGNGIRGFGGDGGPAASASLFNPNGVIVDSDGSLFISDSTNNRVRKIDGSTGIISTIAGKGAAFYSGDGGPAALADLNSPSSLAEDGGKNIYIADSNNNRARKVASFLAAATWSPTSTATVTATPPPLPASTSTPTLSPTAAFTATRTPFPTATPTLPAAFTPAATSTPACETHVWPDPFNPATAIGGFLKISCIPTGGTVSFFTLSGELVRTVQEVNGLALWDGQNRNGILVSAGVYFYVIQQGEKPVRSGKLIVMNSRG